MGETLKAAISVKGERPKDKNSAEIVPVLRTGYLAHSVMAFAHPAVTWWSEKSGDTIAVSHWGTGAQIFVGLKDEGLDQVWKGANEYMVAQGRDQVVAAVKDLYRQIGRVNVDADFPGEKTFDEPES